MLGATFHITRVLCDSGFYTIDFIKYLEHKGFTYIIAVSISHAIQQMTLGFAPGLYMT